MSETIENIVREMREVVKHPLLGVKTEREKRCEKFLKDIIEEFADRIEAAHRREIAEAAAAKCEVCDVQPVTDCNQLNMAKAREALQDCVDDYESGGIDETSEKWHKEYFGEHQSLSAWRKAKAALSAPARNCDRFGGDIEKLCEACLRERGLNLDEDFHEVFCEWLLEAKGDAE